MTVFFEISVRRSKYCLDFLDDRSIYVQFLKAFGVRMCAYSADATFVAL